MNPEAIQPKASRASAEKGEGRALSLLRKKTFSPRRAVESPTESELRTFGFVLGAGCSLIFGLATPLLRHHAFPRWPWIAAFVIWALALSVPAKLREFHRVWTKVGHAIGRVQTRLVLGIIFALVIVPVGYLRRWMKIDPLKRSYDPNLESYRVAAASSLEPKSMERPY